MQGSMKVPIVKFTECMAKPIMKAAANVELIFSLTLESSFFVTSCVQDSRCLNARKV